MSKYGQPEPGPLNTAETAKRLVDDLLRDLTGRSGGDAFWYSIDRDVRREFVATWREIVTHALTQHDPASPTQYTSWLDEDADEEDEEDEW